jgi:hypothetical protein
VAERKDMRIALQTVFVPRQPAETSEEEWCTRQLKRALNRLGYYTPPENTGITTGTEPDFLDALTAFQRIHAIPFADPVGPNSLTERILNEEMDGQYEKGLYTWKTVGDEKVRGDHASRDERRFTWDSPPEGGHPGEDYNCRCWAEPLAETNHPWLDWARERAEERKRQVVAENKILTDLAAGKMGVLIDPSNPNLYDANAATLLWSGTRISIEACLANGSCRTWLMREAAKIILENTHHVPPKTLPAFPDAKKSNRKGGREMGGF